MLLFSILKWTQKISLKGKHELMENIGHINSSKKLRKITINIKKFKRKDMRKKKKLMKIRNKKTTMMNTEKSKSNLNRS